MRRILFPVLLAGAGVCASAAERPVEIFSVPLPGAGARQSIWNTDQLFAPPKTFPAEEFAAGGQQDPRIWATYFESVAYRGRPTRVFAWIGVPEGRREPGPAMVLVHGGGGTAFRSWLKTWVDRGYAAIAMDTCGAVPATPNPAESRRRRSEWGGPDGWGGFTQIDEPVEDQWMYHAVAAVVLGHSLLRSLPEVDPQRVGLTGISWGGIISGIVAGVDSRFRFVAPVYGAGFLGENSYWRPRDLQAMGRERAMKWLTLWDPSQHIGRATMPALFSNGTNDKFFPPDSWQKTYRAKPGEKTLSLIVRMFHSHAPAGDPPEIAVYADALLRGGKPLPKIVAQGRTGDSVWARYTSEIPVTKADLVFTRDSGDWVERHWQTLPAVIDSDARRVTARVPAGATAHYLNLMDARGCIVSTEHEVRP